MGLADTRTRRCKDFFPSARPKTIFLARFSPRLRFSVFRCARVPFYRRPRRRFILIPFCNASPGTGRKSFLGQKLKGLKARRNDSTLSYVHYHFPFCSPYTSPARTQKHTIPFRRRVHSCTTDTITYCLRSVVYLTFFMVLYQRVFPVHTHLRVNIFRAAVITTFCIINI